jgi:hypothetical protein
VVRGGTRAVSVLGNALLGGGRAVEIFSDCGGFVVRDNELGDGAIVAPAAPERGAELVGAAHTPSRSARRRSR